MVASDLFSNRARPWLMQHHHEFIRIGAALVALGTAWWLVSLSLPLLLWGALLVYASAHLVLMVAQRRAPAPAVPLVDGLAMLVDAGLALLLLSQASVSGYAIYPIYLLIAVRVLLVYQRIPAATVVPFMLGPAYLFAESLARQSVVVSPFDQGAQWVMLLVSLAFGAVAIWSTAAQQRENQLLRQGVRNAKQDAERRVAQLESTTNDLRARMREQHALEEGLRVVTSSLSLDEVLNQIVDSTVQMLGPNRVHAIALSFIRDGEFENRLLVLDGSEDGFWAGALAQRAMRQQVPLIINDLRNDSDLTVLITPQMRSAMSVPLFVGEGTARGALTVLSPTESAFSSSDARHLTAFAMQAGIAIGNAEMHSRLRSQQALLESVMRDISDGLVVVDAYSGIVLANPIGRSLLDTPTTTGSVREELLALATSMRGADKGILTAEIRLGEENSEDECTYQALASRVHQEGSDEPLVAIALHDITEQKDEERSRTEFISMVAHELRNPLNSLNGFVKLVLQGRAGALTPLQQEFLQIADSQIEQLKGRISELLEFNRVEAGRLVLAPEWNDLHQLVTSTVTRLRLHAEQNSLDLRSDVRVALPECCFDYERIGQVLNNLVDNAIKATPAGGTVTVSVELHDDEVWVRVCDTGVGIPPEDQSKIFQAFYRAHDKASSKGNHLGLGLTICQQIIEGHKGRIWVESEYGRGSCFSFALPLVEREMMVGTH